MAHNSVPWLAGYTLTDNPPPQENAAAGANAEDGSAATGGTSGLARSDTPGRVFPHLPWQRRNSQVHQLPKHMGPHSKHMHQRGYLVDWDLNPSRLLSEDNGYFKIFVGNHTIHMLTVYTNTPEECRMRPWLKHN